MNTEVERAYAEPVVAHARAVVGQALQAVLVYGSWARGDARAGSDVDVLVVVDDTIALSRDLYRRWDEHPLTWNGRPVDTHFVFLPKTAEQAGSSLCEAAIDGELLFARDERIPQVLTTLRQQMADGRLRRDFSHGQPYWVRVA